MIPRFVKKIGLALCITMFLWIALLVIAQNGPAPLQKMLRTFTNIRVELGTRGDTSMLRFRELEKTGQVDLLFLGSSQCYRGFDTRKFEAAGYTSFNAGSRAQSPLNSYYLFRDHIPRLKPKLTIIEMFPPVYMTGGEEAIIDLLPNLKISGDLIEMTLATHNFLAFNSLVMRLTDWTHPGPENSPVQVPVFDKYIPGGYVEYVGVLDTITPRSFPRKRIKISENQTNHLRKLVALLKNNDSEVLLLLIPIPTELRASFTNYDEIISEFHEIAKELGIRFVDFNDQIVLNTMTEFVDNNHPTVAGAQRFNDSLISFLKSERILP